MENLLVHSMNKKLWMGCRAGARMCKALMKYVCKCALCLMW